MPTFSDSSIDKKQSLTFVNLSKNNIINSNAGVRTPSVISDLNDQGMQVVYTDIKNSICYSVSDTVAFRWF